MQGRKATGPHSSYTTVCARSGQPGYRGKYRPGFSGEPRCTTGPYRHPKGTQTMIAIHKIAARRRNGDEEAGFTLIELMVVVLIIAILIAIAIPTFLGARSRAQDRAAQSSLRNSLTFQTTASAGQTQVFVSAPSANYIVFSAYSKSNQCFWIADNSQGPGTMFAKTAGACTTGAPTAVATAAALGAPGTVGVWTTGW